MTFERYSIERDSIGPEKAWKMLQNLNPAEVRGPIPPAIQRYARRMSEGNWTETAEGAEPIRLDSKGRLVDGVQRLMAIIFSDTVQWMLVAKGD